MPFIIRKRGQQPQFLAGARVLRSANSKQTEECELRYTSEETKARRFASPEDAETFVRTTSGRGGFRFLRLIEIVEEGESS